MQKLDLHRKSTFGNPNAASGSAPPAGGIASLIAASHNAVMPVGSSTAPLTPTVTEFKMAPAGIIPSSTLAPSTLINPPAPTNLSKTAVIISGERNISIGSTDGGVPSGLMANLWGSSNWGHMSRIERGEVKQNKRSVSMPINKSPRPSLTPEANGDAGSEIPSDNAAETTSSQDQPRIRHRQTISVVRDAEELEKLTGPKDESPETYPNYYPLPLKAQDAQFRILFPSVPRSERVVLVFRATWSPTDQQEFPGRVYVTLNDIYFYSHHLGLVLNTGMSLESFSEVTAASGRDCDFLYLLFNEEARSEGAARVTIKVFLEPLRLLQRRMDYLVQNANSDEPSEIEEVLKNMIKMESELRDSAGASPTADVSDDNFASNVFEKDYRSRNQGVKPRIRIDGDLYRDGSGIPFNKDVTKFRLPPHPVVYAPPGMNDLAEDKLYDVSAKALFHVLFGDKSAVFWMMYCDGWAKSKIHHRRRISSANQDRACSDSLVAARAALPA